MNAVLTRSSGRKRLLEEKQKRVILNLPEKRREKSAERKREERNNETRGPQTPKELGAEAVHSCEALD